jgi:uncharacterized integral membrane protein
VDSKKEVMFTITRNFVRLALLITGILVLVSYAVGAIRMESPMDLWGGIPNSWIPFILVFMGLAVIGFLVFLNGFSYFNGLQMQLTQLFGHGKNMNTNSMNRIVVDLLVWAPTATLNF